MLCPWPHDQDHSLAWAPPEGQRIAAPQAHAVLLEPEEEVLVEVPGLDLHQPQDHDDLAQDRTSQPSGLDLP